MPLPDHGIFLACHNGSISTGTIGGPRARKLWLYSSKKVKHFMFPVLVLFNCSDLLMG